MRKYSTQFKSKGLGLSSLVKQNAEKSLQGGSSVISSIQYYNQKISNKAGEQDNSDNQIIYNSLKNYENQIRTLKGTIKLIKFHQNFQSRKKGFLKIQNFVRNQSNCLEALKQNEIQILQKMNSGEYIQRDFAQILQQRSKIQNQQQEFFLQNAIKLLNKDVANESKAAKDICKILDKNIYRNFTKSFSSVQRFSQTRDLDLKNRQKIVRIVLIATVLMINNKINRIKQDAFAKIFKNDTRLEQALKAEAELKFRGKMLNSLKQYPRMNIQRGLWNWYLSSTVKGQHLFQQCADNLVLHTHCNKTTVFYRLRNVVRARKRPIDQALRKKIIIFSATLKTIFTKRNKNLFQQIKVQAKNKQNLYAKEMIVKNSKKQIGCIKLWLKNAKQKIKLTENQEKIKSIQQIFLKRLLQSKVGKIYDAIKKWRQLPQKNKSVKYDRLTKFQKGLSDYFNLTIKRSYIALKNELEAGQAIKKKAVIQMINTTQSGQKKLFSRWLTLTQKHKTLNECKLVANVLSTITFAIKSVSDTVFIDNKQQNIIKEKALIQLFTNMQNNMRNFLKHWRDKNYIQKLRQRPPPMIKQGVLKVLAAQITKSEKGLIREAVNKFKKNRKIVDIQTNFFKKLLVSKARIALIAFQKFQSLPNKKVASAGLDKLAKFQRGLSNYFDLTMKRSYIALKNELEASQAIKKRAVIQMINTTQSGQKRSFTRWMILVKNYALQNRCRQVFNLFSQLNRSCVRTFKNFFTSRSLNFYQIRKLQNLFHLMSSNSRQNTITAVNLFQESSRQVSRNKWYNGAARLLSLHSKINIQKSYWRLRQNVLLNQSNIQYQKSHFPKKLLSFLYKNEYYLKLVAFFSIMRVGKKGAQKMDVSMMANLKYEEHLNGKIDQPQSTKVVQNTILDLGIQKLIQSSIQIPINGAQLTGIRIASRVFSRNFQRQLDRWRNNVNPTQKIQRVCEQVNDFSVQVISDVSKYGAIENSAKILKAAQNRILAFAFRFISFSGLQIKKDIYAPQDLDQKMELINRQNTLMQEIRDFRQLYQQLSKILMVKEQELNNANQTINILSMRINFILVQKFIGMTSKTLNQILIRHLNKAFDCIIDKANEVYQSNLQEVDHD